MINWSKGLTPDQEEKLAILLEKEAEIPVKTYTFKSNNKELVLTGQWLPQNKLVQEREVGYTHYIKTEDELVRLSAFHWELKEK